MEKKSSSTKDILLEHSRAKVELLKTYLSTYLNIISRVDYYEGIFIYDLFCGEGKYDDDNEGSPLAILRTIKNHYYSNNNSSPNIDVILNDNGNSDIEVDKLKIERVKILSSKIFKPNNVNIHYYNENYLNIGPLVLNNINKYKRHKHLIFIDPHGYKDISINQIISLLSIGNAEVILFLPLFDMYRFARKSYDKDFKGGNALRSFLNDSFDGKEINFSSVFDFTDKLKEAFSKKTKCFVDTFLLEKEKSNYYGLFFFTPNALGFEKMLESKWKIDTEQGRGFTKRIESQSSLFDSNVEVSKYPYDLEKFLGEGNKTNGDIYMFGLKKGYLPRHTKEVLKPFRDNGKLIVVDVNGKKAPGNGYYLKYENYKSPPKKKVFYLLNK
jgi:three-Cys-motif partner protein